MQHKLGLLLHPEGLILLLPNLDLVRKRQRGRQREGDRERERERDRERERERERERQYRATMEANYDRRHAAVEATMLSAGDRVRFLDLQTERNVIRNRQAPRSVLIKTPRSRPIVLRNRRMTRHLLQPTSHDAIYELPTLTHLHDPVRVPRDTDSDYLAAIKDQARSASSLTEKVYGNRIHQNAVNTVCFSEDGRCVR